MPDNNRPSPRFRPTGPPSPHDGLRTGFTLIELLVLLALMGILAGAFGFTAVRIIPRRSDLPTGGLRTMTVGDLPPPCDRSELERLEQLPPEGRKALEPTYKERAQKDLERVDALETELEGLKAEKAVLQGQPASRENRDKLAVLKDKIFQAERDLENSRLLFDLDTECLLRIAADTASPVPAPPSPTPAPAALTRTPAPAVPSSPAPAASVRTPAPAVPSSPEPVGIEPPHQGPPDSG